MTIPGSIAVLATAAEFERNGFGTAALKVALLYMKEHYVHRNVQVLADTFEDDIGESAVGYWVKMGFKFRDREQVVRKVGDTESICRWMEAEIDDVLNSIGDGGPIACIIDAGSYSKIRKPEFGVLQLYFCYELYAWNSLAIKDVPGLGFIDPSLFEFRRARQPLKNMGITEDDVRKAVDIPGKAVDLRAGARAKSHYRSGKVVISELKLPIPFRQEGGNKDTENHCVQLAAACGIFYYNETVAKKLKDMSTVGTGVNRDRRRVVPSRRRITIITLRQMLTELDVQFKAMGSVSIDSCLTGPLVEAGGLLFVLVVDQNGTAGHCIVIDLFRKVILDPCEDFEVILDRSNLLKCAGPMSLCMEFKDVLQIESIDGLKIGELNYDLRKKMKNKVKKGKKKREKRQQN